MPASNCLRSPHVARLCDGCGRQPQKHLHITLDEPGFWRDRGCCPACNPPEDSAGAADNLVSGPENEIRGMKTAQTRAFAASSTVCQVMPRKDPDAGWGCHAR